MVGRASRSVLYGSRQILDEEICSEMRVHIQPLWAFLFFFSGGRQRRLGQNGTVPEKVGGKEDLCGGQRRNLREFMLLR